MPYSFNMTDLDKSTLIKTIEDSYELDTTRYDAQSVANFNSVLANAVLIANDLYTSQQKVDDAVSALEKAVEN